MMLVSGISSRTLVAARLATCAVFLGNGFGIGTWAAQLPRFKVGLGLSDGALSLALLAFALGAILAMPAIGWLTTRWGSRRVTLIAATTFTVALFLPGGAPNLAALVTAALLAGACNGAMDVAMNTNATVVERLWKAPIMSSFHAFFSLGGLAGAALSALLIDLGLDLPTTLLVACGVMGVLFLTAAFGLMEDDRPMSMDHGFALPRRGIMALALLTLLCLMVEGAMIDWSAIYLQSVAGASLEVAVIGFAAFSLTMTICRFTGDLTVRRFGRVRTLQLGASLAASGIALAIAFPTPAVAMAGFALVGIGLANTVPVLFSAAGQAPGISPGMGVAMVATLGYAGLLLGPPLIGFGGDLIGLRPTLVVLVIAALTIATLSRRVVQDGSA
jgi:MFS family permease